MILRTVNTAREELRNIAEIRFDLPPAVVDSQAATVIIRRTPNGWEQLGTTERGGVLSPARISEDFAATFLFKNQENVEFIARIIRYEYKPRWREKPAG